MEILINRFLNLMDKFYQEYRQKYLNLKVGLILSGGIDSSIIAYFTANFFNKVKFFTLANNDQSEDVHYAKILNQKLKKDHQVVYFDQKIINEIKPTVIDLFEKNQLLLNPTQLSLGLAFFLLCQEAKKDRIEVLFTGQGPDILLAGYHFYKKIPLDQINQEIKKNLSLLEIDNKRDQTMASFFNIQLVNPYLEKKLIDFFLKIPADYKISKINNEVYEKYFLRLAAKRINLPVEIILRHKKALQYSTKIMRFI